MSKPQAGKQSTKAAKTVAAVAKGIKTVKKKIRTSPHFYRPKTESYSRKPKAPAHLVRGHTKFDDYRILTTPLTSESALKKVETTNTLVFLCDPEATKARIRAAVARRYAVKVVKCNTLIRPDGKKKAFVRLHADYDALDLANKIGIL
eukprot:Gregarina_sp_Poly_1__2126@NODE_1563_length_3842_cov_229_088477_g281_i1_p6_GENE_NODE_1563_length_3842_cov_229_088477_g281_i1NODE_1563_length_3842_cov_229_088477_g281_i1_p6_ORF_typecomplete_len148_score19_74Ribosomal_L23/PF00276_20/6_7e03Ribosomal_L23/PF00276_20/7_3e17Ribosomal_L23eN/PF03939_13/2_2e10Ribosomal_L23eN/PF03939_13/5_9e03_NODE_1563_length_3842_cov_229_088477_g281_i132863729